MQLFKWSIVNLSKLLTKKNVETIPKNLGLRSWHAALWRLVHPILLKPWVKRRTQSTPSVGPRSQWSSHSGSFSQRTIFYSHSLSPNSSTASHDPPSHDSPQLPPPLLVKLCWPCLLLQKLNPCTSLSSTTPPATQEPHLHLCYPCCHQTLVGHANLNFQNTDHTDLSLVIPSATIISTT